MTSTIRLVEIRRVSTKEQALDDRAGLLRQEAENIATASRVGAQIVRTFIVQDVSRASMRETSEWREVRGLIAAPDVHLVLDRLDRLVADLQGMEILNECRTTATRIYTSGGDFDLSTSGGRMLGAIQSLVAGDELATIRHRVQGAKEAKRRKGIFPSSDICLARGIAFVRTKGQPGRWTFNSEIEKIQRAFAMVSREGITNWSRIAKECGLDSGRSVTVALKNPIYMGVWRVDKRRETGTAPMREDGRRRGRREVARAPHEVIEHQVYRPRGSVAEPGDTREEAAIDVASWEAVQIAMGAVSEGYYSQREPRGDTRFVYSGIVACVGCRRPMMSKTKHTLLGVRRDHYACPRTQKAGGRCATKFIRLEVVNAALDRLFGELLTREEFVAQLVRSEQGAGAGDVTRDIAKAKTKLQALTTKRGKLLDLYLDDAFSREQLDAKRSAIDADVDRARRELARLEASDSRVAKGAALEELRDMLAPFAEFDLLRPQQKRDLLRVRFPRVYVSAKGIESVLLQMPRSTIVSGRDVPIPEHVEPLTLPIHTPWPADAPEEMAEFGLPLRDVYTALEVQALMGWSPFIYADRLRRGLIPRPTGRRFNRPAWTIDEVRALLATKLAGIPVKQS